jgi:hypothetical protein
MEHVQSFALPGLTLDAIRCLSLAHDFVEQDLQDRTRRTILSLRTAHTTEAAAAIVVLRRTAKHMVDVEENLNQRHRHITAEKVRGVRQRVQHLVLS